jgi:hypothetical protein
VDCASLALQVAPEINLKLYSNKKKSLSTKLPMEVWHTVGKMNGTAWAITNRLQNSFKITCADHRIIEILGLRFIRKRMTPFY